MTTLVNLLAGSYVVASLATGWPNAELIGGLVVVVMSLCSIVFRWSEEAQHFTDQYRAYTDIAIGCARLGGSMTFPQYRQLKADYLRIELQDGPTLDVLHAICFKEECDHEGHGDVLVPLRWWQVAAANWLDLPPAPRRKPAQD